MTLTISLDLFKSKDGKKIWRSFLELADAYASGGNDVNLEVSIKLDASKNAKLPKKSHLFSAIDDLNQRMQKLDENKDYIFLIDKDKFL